MKHRPSGCSPATTNAPMWQRQLGFFLADLGNWIAGWPWKEDHYMRGVTYALEWKKEEELK